MILDDRIIRAAAFSNGPILNPSNDILCCFWDLESTGLSVQCDDIIQIGATCRLYKHDDRRCLFDWIPGDELTEEDHDFCVYVTSKSGVPQEISELTGITNMYLARRGTDLHTALDRWLAWIQSLLVRCSTHTQVWFIAHNGNQFDLPLLFHQEMTILRWHPGTFLKQVGVTGIVDSLVLSRALFFAQHNLPDQMATQIISRSHRLSDLYKTRFGSRMPHEHNALYDAKAIQCVMGEEPFSSAWQMYLIGWRSSEYIRAFYRAFNKSQQRRSSKNSPPELHVNRHLFNSVSSGESLWLPALANQIDDATTSPPWRFNFGGSDCCSSTPGAADDDTADCCCPSPQQQPSTLASDTHDEAEQFSVDPAQPTLPSRKGPESSRSRAFKYWQSFRTKIK